MQAGIVGPQCDGLPRVQRRPIAIAFPASTATTERNVWIASSSLPTAASAMPSLVRAAESSGRDVRYSRYRAMNLRMGKVVKVSRLRLASNLDVFNVFNANNVLAQNGSYSAAWRTPSGIVGGRLMKFSVVVEF